MKRREYPPWYSGKLKFCIEKKYFIGLLRGTCGSIVG
jgi:hypothetical protein